MLCEEVVHVAAGLAGPGDAGHLAGQRAAAADTVEAQHVGGTDPVVRRVGCGYIPQPHAPVPASISPVELRSSDVPVNEPVLPRG